MVGCLTPRDGTGHMVDFCHDLFLFFILFVLFILGFCLLPVARRDFFWFCEVLLEGAAESSPSRSQTRFVQSKTHS